MRTLVLCAVLVLSVPALAQQLEDPANRKMCLETLPLIGDLRKDLVGPLDFKNPVSAGVSIVAHTLRKDTLNCVFLYEKPYPTYIHIMLHLDTQKLLVVRLAPAGSGLIDLKSLAKEQR